ncbi:unnamed protein product [Symbiodinium necroappetens]|uniref:Uncharacterized protein n=1 Tax=Symbiodinium necroappetens TaxID=1628268 RepID=A0A812SCN1_9DINO|nr:unnamed protein product [Symbiodinium necroappetens]
MLVLLTDRIRIGFQDPNTRNGRTSWKRSGWLKRDQGDPPQLTPREPQKDANRLYHPIDWRPWLEWQRWLDQQLAFPGHVPYPEVATADNCRLEPDTLEHEDNHSKSLHCGFS